MTRTNRRSRSTAVSPPGSSAARTPVLLLSCAYRTPRPGISTRGPRGASHRSPPEGGIACLNRRNHPNACRARQTPREPSETTRFPRVDESADRAGRGSTGAPAQCGRIANQHQAHDGTWHGRRGRAKLARSSRPSTAMTWGRVRRRLTEQRPRVGGRLSPWGQRRSAALYTDALLTYWAKRLALVGLKGVPSRF